MSMFRCKMCGGTLDIQSGMTVAECEYCGTKQTLPRLDNDKKRNLYDRANHFRRSSEYDKAMAIYEQILNEDSTDAEAYWSLVLGRYGIEYVEDPATHRQVPTVNRAQFTSIFADEDYKSALEYADGYQRRVYEAEAKAIDEIQKGILNISRQEEPFDVFICYKENDAMGRRTPDSVLANDLYHQLTEEGFKVFFARITLEDKLGSAYEPYIFAALNSAKVMVALGTKPEYFKAVWVKNEWFRYLSLIKKGENKVLIPAYKDMDPYDLPEEFSHLQAQDMSQIGFLQDLIRGIRKILNDGKQETRESASYGGTAGSAGAAPLLKRVFLFLEDQDWESADEYCEKVLDLEPENARAYLGKLMAELRVSREEHLGDCNATFEHSNHYQKILRFADPALKETVQGYIKQIKERNEYNRCLELYQDACRKKQDASLESEYLEAAEIFRHISGFQDADALAEQCRKEAEVCQKNEAYQYGCERILQCQAYLDSYGYKFEDKEPYRFLSEAIEIFRTIPGWKDADEKLVYCEREIQNIKQKQEEDRLQQERKKQQEEMEAQRQERRAKIRKIILRLMAVAAVVAVVVYFKVIAPWMKYQEAMIAVEDKEYFKARSLFLELGEYKDSNEQLVVVTKKEEEEEQRKKALEEEEKRKKRIDEIKDAEIGDFIYWGKYVHDDTEEEKELIKWRVIDLDEDKNKILVISEYCLDCQPFHEKKEAVSWKKSSIRKWLNGFFLEEAFNEQERVAIPAVKLKNEGNPLFGTKGGENTKDQVFLLSINQIEEYFPWDYKKQTGVTYYAKSKDIRSSDVNGAPYWMTRTMGKNKQRVAYISKRGQIDYEGCLVNDEHYGIRPALWIDLEKLE